MREVPDCLNRRYQALDELIGELSMAVSSRGSDTDCPERSTKDPGIKLMCDFWNILKENPDCDLPQAVERQMELRNNTSGYVFPHHVTCYMAENRNTERNPKKETDNKNKGSCINPNQSPAHSAGKQRCCNSGNLSLGSGNESMPLSKVLCNLKEAASYDKKCNAKLNDLLYTEKRLQEQIQHLEHREKEGVQLLKQADCMWSCMEDAYKKSVSECMDKQKILINQMKDVETSASKWRKNKKDLEAQLVNIDKCQKEITEKINQKTNDMKCIELEIVDFKKRIESNKKETEASKKSITAKKLTSDAKIANIAQDIATLEKVLKDEVTRKKDKEVEGNKYISEARADLQKICKVLLQKKLENEDLKAESEALTTEVSLLNQTMDKCKEKCKNKQLAINAEIKKVELEIANFKVRCTRCHECTDTGDVRRFCTDCPRCATQRDCLLQGDHCDRDPTMDCVCQYVKHKFLDNVFENMYTVLDKQAKTSAGKTVAEAVLNCLKKSRNGKLDEPTRKILQEFILTTVKKNLNLTIVGGAVKTRCELDAETYKQLILCLKQVKMTRAPKVDKGTSAKKDPCRRWGGVSECNCPYGPKACICTKKAPPKPRDPTPCPPDKEDLQSVPMISCPHKENMACGPDCGMHGVQSTPSRVGTDVSAWRPDPCQGTSCPFTKNMRAAQCVLGPESLSTSKNQNFKTTVPYFPDMSILEDQIMCKCGAAPIQPCICHGDRTNHSRQIIIDEVMGRYAEVSPIEKVTLLEENGLNTSRSQIYISSSSDDDIKFLHDSAKKYTKNNQVQEFKTNRYGILCDCNKNRIFPITSKKKYEEKGLLKNDIGTGIQIISYHKLHKTSSTKLTTNGAGSNRKTSSLKLTCNNSATFNSHYQSLSSIEKTLLSPKSSLFARKSSDSMKAPLQGIFVKLTKHVDRDMMYDKNRGMDSPIDVKLQKLRKSDNYENKSDYITDQTNLTTKIFINEIFSDLTLPDPSLSLTPSIMDVSTKFGHPVCKVTHNSKNDLKNEKNNIFENDSNYQRLNKTKQSKNSSDSHNKKGNKENNNIYRSKRMNKLQENNVKIIRILKDENKRKRNFSLSFLTYF